MERSLLVSEWVDHLNKEYLSTFIKNGGATIKFVVADEAVKPRLKRALKSKAEELDYLVIDIDSSDCRFHMPQDIFFALAKQVDWRLIARKFIFIHANKFGFQTNNIDPKTEKPIFQEIATENDLSKNDIFLTLMPELYSIPKNKSMVKDFRVAMTQLCLQEGHSGGSHYGGQPIVHWLTGSNTRITNVKPFLIYTPINTVLPQESFSNLRSIGFMK